MLEKSGCERKADHLVPAIGHRERFSLEALFEPKSSRRLRTFPADLDDVEDKVILITVGKIPVVGVKLMLDGRASSRRRDDPEGLRAPDIHPEKAVEADEMIHVHVRDEKVTHPQQIPGTERAEIACIKQERFTAVEDLQEKGRVAEATVYQSRVQHRAHCA
jgi:hypothetical protein